MHRRGHPFSPQGATSSPADSGSVGSAVDRSDSAHGLRARHSPQAAVGRRAGTLAASKRLAAAASWPRSHARAVAMPPGGVPAPPQSSPRDGELDPGLT